MKKVAKAVLTGVLGVGLLAGGGVVSEAAINQETEVSVVSGPTFEVPVVELGAKVNNSEQVKVTYFVDGVGINFNKHDSFESYKAARDEVFEGDLPMAKDYWKLMNKNIMPVLEEEYMEDIYKAKVFYGYVAWKDQSSIQFGKTLDQYLKERNAYLAEDMKTVEEYWQLLNKDIKPILEKEYKRDVDAAKEYFKAKEYGAI